MQYFILLISKVQLNKELTDLVKITWKLSLSRFLDFQLRANALYPVISYFCPLSFGTFCMLLQNLTISHWE